MSYAHNATGLKTYMHYKIIGEFASEKKLDFPLNWKATPYWIEFGENELLTLIQNHDICSYAQLPPGLAKFCRSHGARAQSESKTLENKVTCDDDEFKSWCKKPNGEMTKFTTALWELFQEKRAVKEAELQRKIEPELRVEHSNARKRRIRKRVGANLHTFRGSFLRAFKFTLNDHLARLLLSSLKDKFDAATDLAGLIDHIQQEHFMDSDDDLPMESLHKFWESLDNALLKGYILFHLDWNPGSSQICTRVIRLVFLFAYERHLQKFKWTKEIFDALPNYINENQELLEKHAPKTYERQRRARADKKTAMKNRIEKVYKKTAKESHQQTLFMPTQEREQEYHAWLKKNEKHESGQSWIDFCVEKEKPLPYKWHIIPLPTRFKWDFDGDLPNILKVHPGDKLPKEILNLIVNSNHANKDHWNVHTWWNGSVEGALRFVQKRKDRHLDHRFDFILVFISPENPDYHRLRQDTYWSPSFKTHVIPHNRKHFFKFQGSVTGDGALIFSCGKGSMEYSCIGHYGSIDRIPSIDNFLQLINDGMQLSEDIPRRISPQVLGRDVSESAKLRTSSFKAPDDPAPIIIENSGQSGLLEQVMVRPNGEPDGNEGHNPGPGPDDMDDDDGDQKQAPIDLTKIYYPPVPSDSDDDVIVLEHGRSQPTPGVPVAASAYNHGQGNGHDDDDDNTRVSETTAAGLSLAKSEGAASTDRHKKKRAIRKVKDQKGGESSVPHLKEQSLANFKDPEEIQSPIDWNDKRHYLNDDEALAAVAALQAAEAQQILPPRPRRQLEQPPLHRQRAIRPGPRGAETHLHEEMDENMMEVEEDSDPEDQGGLEGVEEETRARNARFRGGYEDMGSGYESKDVIILDDDDDDESL